MAWNRPTSNTVDATSSSRPSGRGKMPRLRRGLIAGAIVVLGAGLAAWLLTNGEADSRPLQKKETSKTIRDVKPAVASKPSTQPQTNEQSVVEADEWNQCKLYPGEKLLSSVTNNSSGYIIDMTVDRNGDKTRHIRERPSIWETTTDPLISGVLQANDRTEMPPLPPMGLGMDKEFLKSIERPIILSADDPEDVKAIKRLVRSARLEIKDRIDAGEHFKDILEDYRNTLNDNSRLRTDAIRELNEIRRTGSAADVETYRESVNKMFDKMGISRIGEKNHVFNPPNQSKKGTNE